MRFATRAHCMSIGLALGLAVAACAATTSGPVLGEWAGWTPGRDPDSRRRVDLVLDGTPDAESGTYHLTSTETDSLATTGNGETQWGGTWVRSHRVFNGNTIDIVTLNKHLPADVGGYTLASDGKLHVLDPNGLPDTTPAGALYTLSPVPPRHAR